MDGGTLRWGIVAGCIVLFAYCVNCLTTVLFRAFRIETEDECDRGEGSAPTFWNDSLIRAQAGAYLLVFTFPAVGVYATTRLLLDFEKSCFAGLGGGIAALVVFEKLLTGLQEARLATSRARAQLQLWKSVATGVAHQRELAAAAPAESGSAVEGERPTQPSDEERLRAQFWHRLEHWVEDRRTRYGTNEHVRVPLEEMDVALMAQRLGLVSLKERHNTDGELVEVEARALNRNRAPDHDAGNAAPRSASRRRLV